jgi:outer membrane protein OmpA-like peptidoglycan-associated protein
MAIPVSGDVGDPHFDYGAVIRKAIGSALTRIVTAPFRALASLFGGKEDEEDVGTVRFQPGSAGLSPPQREQLGKIAAALKQRPALKLVVHGPYDPQRDADAVKRLAARRDLATAMGVTLKEREDPGPVAYSDRRTQRALERLVSQRAGDKAVDEVQKECTKRAQDAKADAAEERRLCGEAMFDRLVAAESAPETALQALAQSRAQAIQNLLVKAGVDAARIAIGDVRAESGKRSTVETKLELEAAKKSS